MKPMMKYSSELYMYSTSPTYSLYGAIYKLGIIKINNKTKTIVTFYYYEVYLKSIEYFWNFQCNIFWIVVE